MLFHEPLEREWEGEKRRKVEVSWLGIGVSLFQNILFLLVIRGWEPHLHITITSHYNRSPHTHLTGQPTYLLLPLVIHHFLHHAPRLSIKIWQLSSTQCSSDELCSTQQPPPSIPRHATHLGVLRLDFLSVDLWISSDNSTPPLHTVDLEHKI